jgi:RNA polymerase sigma factor (sigma-70 family)
VRAVETSPATPELPDCYRAFEAELDFVYRMLRRYGATAADADDLAQEVFLVVWRRWRDFDPRRPLRPWLAGIIVRVTHEHFRRRRREVPCGIVDGEDPASPLDHLASARARSLVLRALAALPERQRMILALHDLEGLTIPEVAETMAVPASTLYSRLDKARRTFARAVRRLQREAPLAAARRLPDVEALLAIERTPRPEPPERRRRLAARLRALVALPGPPPPAPRSSRAWPWLVAAGLALAGGFTGLSLPGRRPGLAQPLALPAVRPRAAAGLTLAEGLVGYWRFDEGAGSAVVRDRSGNGTDCELREMNPTSSWTDGPLGGGLSFDGRGWLACPHPRFAPGATADLTVAVWVKRMDTPPGYHAVVTRQEGERNLDHFFVGFRGDLILAVSHVWGGKLFHPAPPIGRWFHLAVVHGHGEVVLFVDGVAVARQPATTARPGDSDTAITVAGGINGPDTALARQRFIGAVDELLVYQRALSPAEIAALAGGVQPPAAH